VTSALAHYDSELIVALKGFNNTGANVVKIHFDVAAGVLVLDVGMCKKSWSACS
jgi:hypothetical protein